MGDFFIREKKGIYYLQPALLPESRKIFSAFSLRKSGVSKGSFASLNLAFHTGDDYGDVKENRRRFFATWGISPSFTVSGNQVHGLNVHQLREIDIEKKNEDGTILPQCDAIINNIKGVVLSAYSADCYLIALYEPKKKVTAIIHAGWRGVVGDIIFKTLGHMENSYKCNRKKILTIVYPGICYNCFEVGAEVVEAFMDKDRENGAFIGAKYPGKFLINLKEIITRQLLKSEILLENIAVAPHCTACMANLFYSYRRDKGKTGRMMAVIGLL